MAVLQGFETNLFDRVGEVELFDVFVAVESPIADRISVYPSFPVGRGYYAANLNDAVRYNDHLFSTIIAFQNAIFNDKFIHKLHSF